MVFLVDASREMFVKGEDGQPSNFDMTMQVRWPVIFTVFCFVSVVYCLFGSCNSHPCTATTGNFRKLNWVIVPIVICLGIARNVLELFQKLGKS